MTIDWETLEYKLNDYFEKGKDDKTRTYEKTSIYIEDEYINAVVGRGQDQFGNFVLSMNRGPLALSLREGFKSAIESGAPPVSIPKLPKLFGASSFKLPIAPGMPDFSDILSLVPLSDPGIAISAPIISEVSVPTTSGMPNSIPSLTSNISGVSAPTTSGMPNSIPSLTSNISGLSVIPDLPGLSDVTSLIPLGGTVSNIQISNSIPTVTVPGVTVSGVPNFISPSTTSVLGTSIISDISGVLDVDGIPIELDLSGLLGINTSAPNVNVSLNFLNDAALLDFLKAKMAVTSPSFKLPTPPGMEEFPVVDTSVDTSFFSETVGFLDATELLNFLKVKIAVKSPSFKLPTPPGVEEFPSVPALPIDLPELNSPKINVDIFIPKLLNTMGLAGVLVTYSGAQLSMETPPPGSVRIINNTVASSGTIPTMNINPTNKDLTKELIKGFKEHVKTISGMTTSLVYSGTALVPTQFPWTGIS